MTNQEKPEGIHRNSLGQFLNMSGSNNTKYRHGLWGTRAYQAWKNIRKRCFDVKNKNYHRYGGRGVTMCPEWRDSPETFFSDMGECPAGLTIDRINNDRGYEPGNCRWVTLKENQNNKSTNRILKFGGKEMSLTQWAQSIGINASTLNYRLRRGWSLDRALSLPKPPSGEGK